MVKLEYSEETKAFLLKKPVVATKVYWHLPKEPIGLKLYHIQEALKHEIPLKVKISIPGIIEPFQIEYTVADLNDDDLKAGELKKKEGDHISSFTDIFIKKGDPYRVMLYKINDSEVRDKIWKAWEELNNQNKSENGTES